MKYNDIKLAERETADQKLVRTYCDGISQGAVNSVRWKSSKYLDRAIQTATKFAKANPKFAAEIEACITSGRAKYAKGGGTVTKQGREINRFRNTDGTGTGPTGPYKDGGYGGNGVGTNRSVGTDTSVGSDNGVAQGVDITGTTPMQKAADQLEGLLNAEDWAGAKALLDSNSDLKALFPPENQDMIDAAIQADIDAIETKEKADAQAAIQKQAKEDAKIAAEQAAAEAAEAAAIAAARKGAHDMIIGNIIGSNVFNTLGVLGLTGAIQTTKIDTTALARDFPIMLLFTIAMFLFANSKGHFSRREGASMLTAYVVYICYLVFTTLK